VYISCKNVLSIYVGIDIAEADLSACLKLYNLYQAEEDDALERKLVSSDDADGKLIRLNITCRILDLLLRDDLVNYEPLSMELMGMSFDQFTVKSGPNRNKTIRIGVESVRWPVRFPMCLEKVFHFCPDASCFRAMMC
jgi:hypothetical protein